ncbi:PqqD family protein [Radicibacter daui]|uniref:PqqD family protein n=1 Tax=Radicibacter daui TaxID=3064829 RepID=UPI004046A8EC
MLGLNDRVQARPDLLSVSADGEMVILDTENSVYLNLNETAAEALRRLETAKRLGELCDELVEVFDAPREEIERDVLEITRKMVEADLVRIV